MIRIYRWRCTDRAIEPLARHDVRCAKGPSLLAISLIYSGICWQGKNADTPFATVNPEGQARGYTVWFLKIPNTVITVNGTQTKGWLHKTSDGRAVFFTRADSGKSETYDLAFVDDVNGRVLSCGTWVAPRLPLFAVGDVNPPCFFEGWAGHNLTRGPHSIAFTTNDGKRLEAHW